MLRLKYAEGTKIFVSFHWNMEQFAINGQLAMRETFEQEFPCKCW